MTAGSARGATVLAAAGYLVVAAALFGDQVLHPGATLRGHDTAYWLGATEVTHRIAFEEGAFPLWNPYWNSGMPWAANPQALLYYPPHWVAFAAGEGWTFGWLLLLHAAFAGLGFFLLARRFGLDAGPAFLAGLAGVAGGPTLTHALAQGNLAQSYAAAWLPWTLLALERARAAPSPRSFTLASGSLAVALFAGAPQILAYALPAFAVVLVVRGVTEGGTRGAARAAGTGAAAIAGSLLLAAVYVFPVVLGSRDSTRAGGLPLDQAAAWAMRPAHLASLLLPHLSGDLFCRPPHGYPFFWEYTAYLGIVPLALAPLAAFRAPSIRRATAWALFAVAAAALLHALGRSTPFFGIVHGFAPPLRVFRCPARSLHLLQFAGAMLAGFGAQVVSDAAPPRPRRVRAWAAVFLLGALGAALVAALLPEGASETLVAVRRRDAVALATLAAVSALAIGRGSPRVVPLGLAAVALADALLFARGFATGLPLARSLVEPPRSEVETLLARRFAEEPPGRLVEFFFERGRMARSGLPTVLDWPTANDPTLPRECEAFLQSGIYREHPETQARTLDLLNARYDFGGVSPAAGPRTAVLVATGRRVEFDADAAAFSVFELERPVFERTSALPRAWLVPRARNVRPGDVGIEDLLRIDPRRDVLIEGDALAASGAGGEARGEVVVEARANRLTARVRAERDAWLVWSEWWNRGRSATLDGAPVPLLRANGWFCAVRVPAGEHEVSLRYRPPGFAAGLAVSLAAWATFVAALATRRRGTRD